MRVLQVIGAMDRGGAETMLMNLYRAVDRDAVQFDFLVHEERECDYDEEIRDLGGHIYRLPRYTIANGTRYRRLCHTHFDSHPEHSIVHGHIGSCAWIYLAEAKRAQRATVLHSHAQDLGSFPERQVFRALVKPSLRYADEFIACSPEAGLDRFGAEIVNGARYRVLANGVDVNRFACDDAMHDAVKQAMGFEGRTVVGHVGRFAPEKNHEFLLQVFSRYLESDPTAILLLLGRGPLESRMIDLAKELGIRDSVIFGGVQEDVPLCMNALDLFLFPSVSEGLPVATIEAQAAGVKCILSTGVPASAAVCDTTLRLPLDRGPAEWANAARDLLGTHAVRSDGARCVAEAGYNVEASARALTELYQELSGNPR